MRNAIRNSYKMKQGRNVVIEFVGIPNFFSANETVRSIHAFFFLWFKFHHIMK